MIDADKMGNTQGIAPLLVRLYDSNKLYNLVKNDKPLARAELTRAVTDLFQENPAAKEQELLADILIALMRQAERVLRQALAEKLAPMDNVPLRLILHLVNDEITVASPVLKKSPVLSDLDLIYIINAQGPDYWQAIASRESLSDELIDTLAGTRDLGTAFVLTKNERISLTAYAFDILGDMAKKNQALATPLLKRPEIPESLARSLFDYVGKELKDYILSFYGPDQKGTIGKMVDETVLSMTESGQTPEFMPTEQMRKEAGNLARLGMLNMDVMMETLQSGRLPEFIAQFAQYTRLDASKIHDFLRQPCPKGMAIACRAFRIQKSDFSKIYLMTHRMRSKHRLINHKDMLDVLKYFDKVRPEVALRIVHGVHAKL